MDFQLTDLSDVLETDEAPRLARVGRLVDAAAEDHVRPNRFASRAHINDVGVRVRHVNRADRSGGDLPVGHWEPGVAVVLGLPHTAAARAHVEDVRLRPNAGRRRGASAAMGPDRSPAEVLVRFQINDPIRV